MYGLVVGSQLSIILLDMLSQNYNFPFIIADSCPGLEESMIRTHNLCACVHG